MTAPDARRRAEEAFRGILEYEPNEVCKDAFAYDRMVEAYREAARKGLALLAYLPPEPAAASEEVREAAERLWRALTPPRNGTPDGYVFVHAEDIEAILSALASRGGAK